MVDEIFGALHGAVQIAAVVRETVAHRESVESPALAPRPCRSLRIALSALLRDDLACSGVVTEDVEATVIGPEVVFERVVGMGDGDVAVASVAGEARNSISRFIMLSMITRKGLSFPSLLFHERISPTVGLNREINASEESIISCL